MSIDFWLIISFVMLILEVFISGVFIMWFGFGGLLIALTTYLGLTSTLLSQCVLFGVISSMVFAGHYIYDKKFKKEKKHKVINNYEKKLINKIGIIEEIDENTLRGKVDGSIFNLNNLKKESFNVGDKFVVKSINGINLNVEKF